MFQIAFQNLHETDKGLTYNLPILSISYNGPAIWGGCVPPAGGWRGFCRPGISFVRYTSVAVQG